MNEIWKAVVGYAGLYEVSDLGRVRSLPREHLVVNPHTRAPMKRRIRGAIKKPWLDRHGYASVNLYVDARGCSQRVSRLVLEAFAGPRAGAEACHLDHNQANNVLHNLVWGTRQENEDQKTLAGRRPASTRSVLTPATVKQIRKLRAKKLTCKQIAAQVGCHLSTVGLAATGKTWRGV